MKPRQNENRDDFINRCMTNGQFAEQYPNIEQRKAEAAKLWSNTIQEQYNAKKEKANNFESVNK